MGETPTTEDTLYRPEEEDTARSRPRSSVWSRLGTDGTGRARHASPENSLKDEDETEQSPFVADVRNRPLPKNFVTPDIGKYNGDSCPKEHLNQFRSLMQLQRAPDEIMCRAFPVTLAGMAATWFGRLRRDSISNFAQLKAKFESQFAGGMRPKKTVAHMFTVKQRPDESVRAYVRRFHKELVQVEDVQESVAIAAFGEGLHDKGLIMRLTEYPAKTLVALQNRANRYASGEKAVKSREAGKRERSPPPDQPKKGKLGRREQNVPGRNAGNRSYPKPTEELPPPPREPAQDRPPKRFSRYTPLKVPVERLSSVLSVRSDFRAPPPVQGGNNRFFCTYHNGYGHSTDRCRALIDDVEQKIREGELADYVDRRDRGATREGRTPEKTRSNYETVLAISGGVTIHGRTRRARSNYAKATKPPTASGGTESVHVVTATKRAKVDPHEISFTEKDLKGVVFPHEDALVISVLIDELRRLGKVLVDSGSSTDVVWSKALTKVGVKMDKLSDYPDPLVGFAGDRMFPVGVINLNLTFGTWPRSVCVDSPCIVVDTPSEWNMIIGRSTMSKIGAVVSTYHQVMKFITPKGVGEERGNQDWARVTYQGTVRGTHHQTNAVQKEVAAEAKAEKEQTVFDRLEPADADGVWEVPLDDVFPDRKVRISMAHPKAFREEILHVLREYSDVFAFSHEEMPGIDRDVIQHNLNADPRHPPVKQKKRSMSPEKNAAVAVEVDKLLKAGFIREIKYSRWLSNVVMVKKSNGQWRM